MKKECLLTGILALVAFAVGTAAADTLTAGFAAPPDSARPWVYWFWLDGNITREGITADLEAMARVGVGGVLIMEVAQGIPTGPVAFAGEEWRALFTHAVSEAHRLGIEVNMNNDAGWCGSGGPWVTPEHAMQRVVWSETRMAGPAHFDGTLPAPAANHGYYRDIATLAFPLPAAEKARMADAGPVLSVSDAAAKDALGALTDSDFGTGISLEKPAAGKDQWIEARFAQPYTARSMRLDLAEGQPRVHARILAGDDASALTLVREFDFASAGALCTLPETRARIWRVVFTHADSRTGRLDIQGLELSPAARIENIEGKSARIVQFNGWPAQFPALAPESVVAPESIQDVGANLGADDHFSWDAPAGEWLVIRFGHTPTGAVNAPAPVSGTGLECDKLSAEAVEAHFDGLMKKLIADCGPMAGQGAPGLTMTHIDSWEVGSQNWSPRFRDDFIARRGYDPVAWLPVFTGRVVGTAEASERFLWDLRRTVGDLVADNYAGHLRELCRRNNMLLSIEAYGDCVFDNVMYAGRADVPMSEFWIGGGALHLGKSMSSAAHTYGHPITAAESFTAGMPDGRWKQHPYSIKALGDQAFCTGINRFVFHRYAMQPWRDRAPGMTMGPWGIHYERTEPWWEYLGPWHEYLARCQFLLQQGRFVADVCYLMDEGAPNDAPQRNGLVPALPEGYDYDACPAELIKTMTVENGCAVLPSGMRYRVLAMPRTFRVTPEYLREIQRLVEAGATIVGPRPAASPSLLGYPACDEEVRRIAAALWDSPGGQAPRIRDLAKLDDLFTAMGVVPDLSSRESFGWIHRTADDADIYFVANAQSYATAASVHFRVRGKQPEYWRPDTGEIEAAPVCREDATGTFVPVCLDARGSVFVVFRGTAANDAIVDVARGGESILPLEDPRLPLTIESAEYGVLEDAARTREVRGEIQHLVDAGERTITVSDLAKQEDPAPGLRKRLRIVYRAGDTRIEVRGQDSDAVRLPDWAPKINVVEAVYGVPGDPGATRNVREKAQRLVDMGEYRWPAARMAEGDDPAFGVVKTLTITYTLDNATRTLSGTDSEIIALAEPPAPALERIAQPRRADTGDVALEAWQGGDYTVTLASGKKQEIAVAAPPERIEMHGPWEVHFLGRGGASGTVAFDTLMSWSDRPEPELRYYSGTAVYRGKVDLPHDRFAPDLRLWLDLGRVEIMARVTLNGKALGTFWKPPFRVDITQAAQPGENVLEVEVVNLFPNRLIGDEQLPEDAERNADGSLKKWPEWLLRDQSSPTGRQTFSTWRLWSKDDALLPSGLLGPVTVEAARVARMAGD